MKFSINSDSLNASLNILAKVQKKDNISTAISNIKFVIKEDVLTLLANDNEIEVSTSLSDVFDVESGSFCVKFEQLSKMLRSLPNQPITITCDDKNYDIILKYNSGKFKMVGSDPDSYMDIKFAEESNTKIMVQSSILEIALNRTKVCVANNDVLRPVMSGVHFDFDNDGMSVVSTDMHNLIYCHQDFESKIEEEQSITIPLKTINILTSVFSQDKEDVTTFCFNPYNVIIECGSYVIKSRLLEGKYPNYKAVIPQNNHIQIEFNRRNLISAIRRVIGFTETSSNLVKIATSETDSSYLLSSENIDFALSAKEKINGNTPTENFKIGINGQKVIDILSVFNDETIVINAKDASSAVLIKTDDKIHTECVSMPFSLTD